ncbi:MAG: hypothetical protein AVO38_04635 [delta proteobacterium ML8_D]|nr:MAG: hypothetical protein AVO38_04635 [delta proteobacterium ML8_D]
MRIIFLINFTILTDSYNAFRQEVHQLFAIALCRWAVFVGTAYFSPRIIAIVPKMNGIFNRCGIKDESFV